MNDDTQAATIKISAVITAMPRWINALLAAEGLIMPSEWLYWWLPLSAIFAAAMAIVEGWAFSYVFSAWRRTSGKAANTLIILATLSAVIFVGVLFPYIASSVRGVTLGEILSNDIALYIWAVCVAASTIAIVASVGYAQRTKTKITNDVTKTDSDTKPVNDKKPVKVVKTDIPADELMTTPVEELAVKYNKSIRTIYRKKEALQKNGHKEEKEVEHNG